MVYIQKFILFFSCFASHPSQSLSEMSSVFVESLCKFPGDTVAYQLAWSHSDPIASLITNTVDERDKEIFAVMILNNEGTILANSTIPYEKEATTMCWQPNGRVVAIGWKDGGFCSYLPYFCSCNILKISCVSLNL